MLSSAIAVELRFDVQTWQRDMDIARLATEEDLQQWVVGCDADIGGFSEARLELSHQGTGLFQGALSHRLPPNNPSIVKSGYAAFKLRDTPSSLVKSASYIDTTSFRYLAVRVKSDERNYFINVQTAGVVATDLFQHRLFTWTPGQWETVLVPWRSFVLTNNGAMVPHQMEMHRERVRSIGFSVADGKEGAFRLEVAWLKAFNSEFTDGDIDIS